MKTKLYLSGLALLLVAAGLSACDKANPVAPAGTVLSVTANPSRIATNGASQIRVVALKPNGTPVNPGTQIRLSTNLGTIDPVAQVGDSGIAVGTLVGDGRLGTATVTASVGADVTATVEVQVGIAAANITLQATPPQVQKETGGSVQLLAVVRDDSGQPLAGATVNFQSEVGVLGSRGGILRTDANGQVTDTLTVTEGDLASFAGTEFAVTAVVGTGSTTQSDTVQILISTCAPIVRFTAEAAGQRRVQVTSNTTTGVDPLTFSWDKESDGAFEADKTNQLLPSFDYATGGDKTITLLVENECGQDIGTVTVVGVPN